MASSIVPTFDFGVNDVPTRADLIRQAKSLRITGLGLSEIAGGTLGILNGDTSGATGALQSGEAVGMMWVDPTGQTWVQEQSGPVRLKNYEGGWESRRYWIRPDISSADIRPGLAVGGDSGKGPAENFARIQEAAPASSLDANEVRLFLFSATDYRDNSNGRLFGFTQETCASNYGRWNGRGGCYMIDHQAGEGDVDVRTSYDEVRNSITFSGARNVDLQSAVMEKTVMTETISNRVWQAWIAGPSAGHTLVSDAGGDHTFYLSYFGYNFGPFQSMRDD